MTTENGQAAGGSAQPAGTPPDGSLDAAIAAELEALEQGQGNDDGDDPQGQTRATDDQGNDGQEQDEGQDDDADEQDEGEQEGPKAAEDESVFEAPNGKKYVVPRELAQGYLRQQDYTQKTMQHAEYVRQHDGKLQELYQGGQQTQAQRAQLLQVQQAIQGGFAFLAENPNLAETDVVGFNKVNAQIGMLQHAQQRLQAGIQQAEQQYTAYEREQMDRRVAAVMPQLQAIGLGSAELGRIEQYARSNGYSGDEVAYLAGANAPHAIVTLEKARRYDELMAQRAKATTKVDSAKRSAVLTPGNAAANNPQNRSGNNVSRSRQRMVASGSVNDAVAHELALMERSARQAGRRR